ncbi:hypothetical protein GCM10009760_20610 [Kitasatospora kazusensis]|uniref:M23ase beta-sheet core domain-containing protein n=1 Tax=Kitasatospora kazusensis TaxID=407974 RepID=A0ABN2Z9L7_9ACTN
MASSHSPSTPVAATQLLDHPSDQPPDAAPDHGSRHRMPRQTRGGPLIGVTAMAASLGATGFATAAPAAAATPPPPAPAVAAPDESSVTALAADPGLALAARIQQQADGRRTSAEETARLAAAQEAEAKRAAQQAEAHAEAQTQVQAPTGAQAEGEAEQAGQGTFALPTGNYTLTAHYGQSGAHWAHLHTGLDFAAPTGTPVTAVGAGTVTSAGWSGAYGYRVIQALPDGTEIWYCHLSAISTTAGPVTPGTVLGRVGATGNSPGLRPGGAPVGPHLHLEVRPDGGIPVDPLPWLQERGVQP